MRILMISPTYYPHVGGVEYVVKAVAERLAKLGHEVTVLAGEPAAERPREEEIKGVRVVRWPTWSPGGAYHLPRRRSELKEAARQMASESDVAYIHSAHAVFTVYAGLAAAGRTRTIFTPHYHGGGHTPLRKALWLFWRRAVGKLIKTADAVHAVSRAEARRVATHYPEASAKIKVVPNGVEEDVLRRRWAGRESDYAVYAGRLERYKRVDRAMELANRLGLRLLVIGDGPDKPRLEKIAAKYGAEIRGFLPREEYLSAVAGARYAINLSEAEAYSVFIAEALAMGVPSIVSRAIAENLEAQGEAVAEGVYLVRKAEIKTWDEVVGELLRL